MNGSGGICRREPISGKKQTGRGGQWESGQEVGPRDGLRPQPPLESLLPVPSLFRESPREKGPARCDRMTLKNELCTCRKGPGKRPDPNP